MNDRTYLSRQDEELFARVRDAGNSRVGNDGLSPSSRYCPQLQIPDRAIEMAKEGEGSFARNRGAFSTASQSSDTSVVSDNNRLANNRLTKRFLRIGYKS
jgi:hypothetical protein